MLKNSLKMRVPKRHPKKHSKNRFWEPFWSPKTLQNRRKILSKTMLREDSKKRTKKSQLDPNRKTCHSKEREERSHVRVVQACNPKTKDILQLLEHAAPSQKMCQAAKPSKAQQSLATPSKAQLSPAKPSKAKQSPAKPRRASNRQPEDNTAKHH